METESNSMLPFLDTQLLNKHTHVETKVCVKPKNTSLLLHYKSRVDDRYKCGLLQTMVDHAFRLQSSWRYFSEKWDGLKLLCVKPKNTSLLLHYKSRVDDRYKCGLLQTMVDHAFRLQSSWRYFSEKWDGLKLLFSRLKYPDKLVNSTISRLVATKASDHLLSYRLKIRPQLLTVAIAHFSSALSGAPGISNVLKMTNQRVYR